MPCRPRGKGPAGRYGSYNQAHQRIELNKLCAAADLQRRFLIIEQIVKNTVKYLTFAFSIDFTEAIW
jgi:hypothetical protein